MSQPYNVQDPAYSGGADPSGKDDCAAAFQAALNAIAAAGGGCLYIPAGNYQLASGLTYGGTTTGGTAPADTAPALTVGIQVGGASPGAFQPSALPPPAELVLTAQWASADGPPAISCATTILERIAGYPAK